MNNPCENCSDCCTLEVAVTTNDIRKLALALGLTESDVKNEFVSNGELKRVNVNGRYQCIFLDKDSCTVYNFRPRVCCRFFCVTACKWMREAMNPNL